MMDVDRFKLVDDDIKTALRVCRRHNGLKDYNLEDYPTIEAAREYIDTELEDYYDFERILLDMYQNMENYWNEVLDSYKRPSAKTNRIEYLIKRASKEKEDPIVTPHKSVVKWLNGYLSRLKGEDAKPDQTITPFLTDFF